ncbi:fructose-specific PTS transporter subunit EIIC [Turicibacter sp. TJ11]|uniref:PTS fructose transporter subunit IIABC n=1 Tax=Turicibacter sp. TJ11 TaxID=2806443 RepID=UPI001F310085|nr:fructose-specific PTS transporter subunit EIIC [Turicibacter sp. TJ11]
MRITGLLSRQSISLDLKADNKKAAIDELVDLVNASGNLSDKEAYKKGIIAREEQSTTGIGEGIAIPHAKTSAVKKACLGAAVSKAGVDYESFDGSLAHLFFMIAAPDGANNTHLEVLSRLSTILMDEDFRKKLMNAHTVDEFLSLIDAKETEAFKEETESQTDEFYEAPKRGDAKYPRVLAVTACPTGIAHTFMAAEALNKKGAEMGISIKVETNGSAGAKNVLTKEEIEHCDAIIVAADKKVEMARFNGKKVIQTKVADGIHKSEELINRAINGDAPIYHSSEGSANTEEEVSESLGRQLYKHLMNGVSNMLPFVVAGGILIALAFLFDDRSINPANFGSNTPLAAFFKSIGDAAFGFLLPVLAGFIAVSIADRPAMVVGFVGGLLANTGGAGFLGALLAGFIAGYLVLGLRKVFSFLPSSLEGIKPVLLYPLFGTLLVGVVMTFVVNPPVAYLNNGLTNFLNGLGTSSAVILGIVVAAMMSIDMGGPFNKAAYVFGIASLQSGNEMVMAAVMAGGMVPPLAIALATTFYKNRFTPQERDSGKVNYVMGASFITEGAIPFAAADPLKVIPSCAIGAAVAGALTMIFGCTLPAPHGGIFVFPVVGNWPMYLVAILVGSIVGAVILGFLKRPRHEA